VFLGGASGVRDRAVADLSLDGPDGAGAEFGASVALDDVNGDLRADLAVGAVHAGGVGRAYLFLGPDPGAPEGAPSVTFPSPADGDVSFGWMVR
jgi:hypothetical protein